MVAVVERIARKKWKITAENGDHFETIPGKQYTTTLKPSDDGTVVVFSNFWVPVPFEVFADPYVPEDKVKQNEQ